ncbi:MAG: hypothetical protein JWP88_1753 [Flaviaesturariibacter sp.]|nr:hypothetical protein [Flaviaesturariibacter sp.]
MNFEYKHLLPADYPPNSRVWIYQSSRLFRMSEALDIEDALAEFCGQWTSHGAEVTAYGNLFFGQFLVLVADERAAGVSGCSTDSSVRFVKELGERFGVDFFQRTNLAFIIKEALQVIPMNQLSYAFENGFITPETPFFNNTITTKAELEDNWIIPVKDSWLAPRLKITA